MYLINMHIMEKLHVLYMYDEHKTAAATGKFVNICLEARCRLIWFDQYLWYGVK